MAALSGEEKERILRAVEEDREFRYALMGLLGFREVLDRITVLEERLARVEERMVKVEEALAGAVRALEKLLREMDSEKRRLERIERILGSLGRRHGLGLERLVLEAYRDLLERLGIDVYRVEKLRLVDREGSVFGVPGQVVDIDVYLGDDVCWLVEVKSFADREDVLLHYHKAVWASRQLGRRCRFVLVAVYVTEEARRLAERLGVDIVAGYVVSG